MTKIIERREAVVADLKKLRDAIIAQFEQLEPVHRFQRKSWDHHSGGGGEISAIRGDVFEKGAVNWSGVSGDKFPMQDGSGPFFATGVSLITHMANPHVPTVHMNVRYIETQDKVWFGGGYDLTPMGFPYDEDTEHFHGVARKTLEPFKKGLYEELSANARDYFYIPHRKKERGVGGIFFDHYNTGDSVKDREMWLAVGHSLIDAVMPIYRKRCSQPYSPEDKEKQQKMRAHYVEFNLLYDRGTRFGFQSGGNPDAILCSMPPTAKW